MRGKEKERGNVGRKSRNERERERGSMGRESGSEKETERERGGSGGGGIIEGVRVCMRMFNRARER